MDLLFQQDSVNKVITALQVKMCPTHQNTSVPLAITVLEILANQLLVIQELIQTVLANGSAQTAQQVTSVITPTQLQYCLLHTCVLMAITALKEHNTLHSTHVPLEHTTMQLVYTAHHSVSTVLVDITVPLKGL